MGEIEPQRLDEVSDEQHQSMVAHFANQVMDSIGSWDAATAICGHDVTEDRVPFPETPQSAYPAAGEPEEEMAVEWEGQEVQLVDRGDQGSVASNERMPPPRRPTNDAATALAFSSLGSCHSWSFFGGSRQGGLSSVASMDMEQSAGENGSLGGGSLTRMFEDQPPHDYGSLRNLDQMPSWERSLRSKSPLSIGSHDDDESLVSKSSSKAMSPRTVPDTDMVWESRE